VVALERGVYRDTYPDGAYPKTINELDYQQRFKLFQNLNKSSFTFRRKTGDSAIPYRQIAMFKPGEGVGGAGLHWSGCHWRILPEELRMRSHYDERYGKKFIPKDMTQDWGDLRRTGTVFRFRRKDDGHLRHRLSVGAIVDDGNPFEADRSDLPAARAEGAIPGGAVPQGGAAGGLPSLSPCPRPMPRHPM
jgi:gluconate 2-dehydrogenase alpha chain